tara:strand:- start:401 stop:4207 length:3807 start_codon:yes stop_codon:yes gene_type:complete
MPLKNDWIPDAETQLKADFIDNWEKNSSAIHDEPLIESIEEPQVLEGMEPVPTPVDAPFKTEETEIVIDEVAYLAQGGEDHPNRRISESQKHKMPTPDEAEEQGLVGQGIDIVSDFTLGMATGAMYGVDELAVSASKLLNMMTPDDIMEDEDEYSGRYISKYMDDISQRTGIDGKPAGEAGQAVGQFVMGWYPALKAVKLLAAAKSLGKVGQKMSKGIPANVLASSLAGASAYAPDHQNLANHLTTIDNHLGGAVARALATSPDNPEWRNRFNTAMTEGGLAGGADIALKIATPIVKGLAGATQKAVAPVSDWFIQALDLQKQTIAAKVYTKNGVGKTNDVAGHKGKTTFSVDKDGKVVTIEDVLTEAREGAEKMSSKSTLEGTLTFAVDKSKSIASTIAEGNAVQANMMALKTVDDRMTYARSIATAISERPKETTTKWLDDGMKFAMKAGHDIEVLKQVHSKGYVSPEIIYGFGHVAHSVAHGMELAIENSKTIMGKLDATADEIADAGANFVRSLADSIEIQQMLSEAGSTSGASLKATQQVVKAFGEGFKKNVFDSDDSKQVLEFFRTSKLGGMELPRVVDMLYEAHMKKGRHGLNGVMKEGFKSGSMQMFIEAWINQGLLSNPGTHMLNLVVGSANLAAQPISQLAAATISKVPFANKVLGTDTVTYREAFGSMYGMLAGLTKAFQLSFKAGVSGKSSWGGSSKIDNYGMQHIAAKSLDMEGTAIGLGIDYMGSLTRAPGRFLLMEDEFVKTVAGEMKKHSLAWRYAYENAPLQNIFGKRTTGTSNIYKEIIDNPGKYKERIGDVDYSFDNQIQEFADLVTFQKKTGALASSLSKAGIQYPLLKLGMPFVKVLANIPKYTIQHSPLGLAFQSSDFKKGGSARMLELGRMSYGTLLMWYGAQMHQTGQLTGTGPREYWKTINAQQTGAQPPRSLKVKPVNAKHNQAYWVDIGRFAPYSSLLLMGADISETVDARDDLNTVDMITKGLTSIQKNLVDPTWAPSLHKVLGAVADSSSEPGDWTRAIKSIVGTMQPAFVRAHEKSKSPGKAELKTYGLEGESVVGYQPNDWSGYVAQLLATTSTHSDLIPTARNMLGKQVKHDTGLDSGLPGILHNPMWSFVNIRKADETPAIRHLFQDLDLQIERPTHIIDVGAQGVKVRLSPHEYDEYVRRIGEMKDEYGHDMKQAFTREFNSIVYKDTLYNGWKNAPEGKAGAATRAIQQSKMATHMKNTYNHHKRRAKASIVGEFNIVDRAQEIHKTFRSNNQ